MTSITTKKKRQTWESLVDKEIDSSQNKRVNQKKEKVWDSGKTEAPTQERGKETSQNTSEEKFQGDSWAAAGLEQSVQMGAGG